MKRAHRTINGRVYTLGCWLVGLNAKSQSRTIAREKRAQGKLVRVIKLSEYDFMVYEIG